MNEAKHNDEAHVGINVVGLFPDHPATKAGVLKGDRIMSVDGVAVNSWQDYIDCAEQRGSVMKLGVLRGNDYLDIMVTYPVNKD